MKHPELAEKLEHREEDETAHRAPGRDDDGRRHLHPEEVPPPPWKRPVMSVPTHISGLAKRPTAITPQKPDAPWIAAAAQGSSIFIQLTRSTQLIEIKAPTVPMIRLSHCDTTSHEAQMLTSPPRMPVAIGSTIIAPVHAHDQAMEKTPPAHAASVVVIATLEASLTPPPVIAVVDPELNEYQLIQRRKVPKRSLLGSHAWKISRVIRWGLV
mmetsp:Transcript_33583/g.81867  ORF Transcript_33583/g.81867 Transcript_33583/m.81867 type:complete len:212 (-) Transcript_33583:1671-2306(-)